MRIGYARVSTDEQKMDLQLDALRHANCEKIFTDTASGARADRTGLREALEFARSGDVIVVFKLDRLGRSLKNLVEIINTLKDRQIGLVSLSESFDTTTPGGTLIFHVFAAIAEFERDLIRERTKAGLNAARARGRQRGRPTLIDDQKKAILNELSKNRNIPVKDICKSLKISQPTYYRYMRSLIN